MSLQEVVAGLEAVQAAQVQLCRVEAARGDALWAAVDEALGWCRADLRANPGNQGLAYRVKRLEAARARWVRKEARGG